MAAEDGKAEDRPADAPPPGHGAGRPGHVADQLDLAAAPDRVWQICGDFHALHAWHPGVAGSTPEDDGKTRRLRLQDGGTVVEQRTDDGQAPRLYRYRIIESALPIKYHSAQLAVEPRDGGSRVRWSCDYEAVPGGEDVLAGAFAAIFRAGLARLKELAASI